MMRRSLLAMVITALMLVSLMPGQVKPQVGEGETFSFDQYHDYGEIKAELDIISTEHQSITRMVSLGRTWEGRDIMALRVTDRPLEEETDEADILIMGAHHANELPSAEVPMFILKFLVENYAANHTVRTLVDSRDIWFVPLVNPDGRDFAMQQDLTWRKNRMPYGDSFGVDVNRNYGHLWGQQGVSTDPGSQLYCGPSAFSENETQAIRALALNQSFDLSLSYHTYGRQVFYPWGNGIDTLHPYENVLQGIANDLAERTGYTPMEGKDLYFTTGDSDDWLYSELSTLPFTIELGGQRNVPPADIEALCLENLDAALYAIDVAADPDKVLLPDWTFMVYMSADADIGLANEALVDINEMEVAGSTANVSIIVLHDGRGTGDSKLYRIQKDPGGFNTAIVSTVLYDLGAVIDTATDEADMSEPDTLHDFTAWAMGKYPAQKYLLSIWGHGDGVLDGFVPDKGLHMNAGELHTALAGLELDIVGLDTCSMGHFEVAYELMGIADIMIGSEALEPLAGWDYQATLDTLVLAPSTEPRALAYRIIADYLAANPENYLTQAALDIGVYQDVFLPMLDDFAAMSRDFSYADYGKIWSARNVTDTYVPEQDAVDLFQFLVNLENGNASGPVRERIERLFDVKDQLIFASGTSTAYPNSRTMAVYFPLLTAAVSADYQELGFCLGGWDEYLGCIRNPVARPFMGLVGGVEAATTAGPYNVTGSISGYGGGAVRAAYRVNGGTWLYLTANIGVGTISASLPGQANGSVIEYYFIDSTNNITEPYEIKWGNTTYPSFTVNASCDLSITGISAVNPGNLVEGNSSVIMVNCTNDGPEPITANITLLNEEQLVIIGFAQVALGAGEWRNVGINCSLAAGTWKITAFAMQEAVFDRNASNQNSSLWVNVSAARSSDNLLGEYLPVIVILVVIWMVGGAAMAHFLRKGRRRRKTAARRSLNAAREFLETAEGLGADITGAALTLAKAEAALESNKLAECDRLVSKAREVAINAVGGGNDTPKKL